MNCARWDLCGGCWETGIPTAILDPKQPFARPNASCLVEDVECGQAAGSREAVPQVDREPCVAGP